MKATATPKRKRELITAAQSAAAMGLNHGQFRMLARTAELKPTVPGSSRHAAKYDKGAVRQFAHHMGLPFELEGKA